MKVIIEIPDKSIEMAKAYLMASCDTEEQENDLCAACERMKSCTEPMEIDFDEIEYQEFKQQLKQMYMAFALITIGAMKMREMNDDKK